MIILETSDAVILIRDVWKTIIKMQRKSPNSVIEINFSKII